MPKLNLRTATAIKVAGGEALAIKGPGFSWTKPTAPSAGITLPVVTGAGFTETATINGNWAEWGADVSAGPGGQVLVAMLVGNPNVAQLTSMTLGGQPATLVARSNRCLIAVANNVPAGTVALRTNYSTNSWWSETVTTYSVSGVGAVHDTLELDGTASPLSGAIDVPANGLLFSMGFGGFGINGFGWVGENQIHSYMPFGGEGASIAAQTALPLQTARPLSFELTGHVDACHVAAASFAPA